MSELMTLWHAQIDDKYFRGGKGATKNELWFWSSLLMWRHEASRRLYLILWMALPLTLLLPATQLSTCLGFYLLFKFMLVDYGKSIWTWSSLKLSVLGLIRTFYVEVFLKFPRLRAKYDTSSLIWQTLPTDADLDARHKVEQVKSV